MCRMIAIVGTPALRREALFAFHHLSRNGVVRPWESPGHSEGWGVACYDGDAAPVHLARSAGDAADELDLFQAAVRQAMDPVQRLVVTHFRKATHGKICLENVHPFLHGPWLFAHNGTVTELERLGATDGAICGTTDSEDLLRRWVAARQPLSALPEWLDGVAAQCPHTSLTCLMSDGQFVLGYRRVSGKVLKPIPPDYDPAEVQHAYYTLHYWTDGEQHILCSEVLPAVHGPWRGVKNGESLLIPLPR
ncbi:MAG: class II glutamine amidotransferase [Deltaproteobacteria bacterium]|nr:class II glutamine amidotransferase [Deltaproteobacteria bacterium]